jgi:trimeric autotransporter adhesin
MRLEPTCGFAGTLLFDRRDQVKHKLSLVRLLGLVTAAGLIVSACGSAAPSVPPTAAPTTVPATAVVAESTATVAAEPGEVATTVQLNRPIGLALAADGKLYFSQCPDGFEAHIYELGLSGRLQIYAGALGWGFSGDGGPARDASFACMGGLAFDGAGNLYVADVFNGRVRRIDVTGTVTTVAGGGPDATGGPGFAGDGGPATAALLNGPTSIAFDRQGNLYIADTENRRVRKVDPQGVITTVAGDGTAGFGGDGGPATAAQFKSGGANRIMAIAVDAAGNLYITDPGNARVRKVDANGIISTIAGTGEPGFSGDDGAATAAQLSHPEGLAVDAEGNVYIADTGTPTFSKGHRIRKIDTAGIITTIAGTGEGYFSGDGGPATAATISGPAGLGFDAEGNLYFADSGNNRVRKVDKNGIITTVAGGGF